MVGIVILNYKNWNETIDCVNSIIKTTKIKFKIYIVDNYSPNNSFEELSCYFEDNNNIVIIHSDNNCGYAAGNNLGIKTAMEECDEILVSNPDIIFRDNAIDNMIDFLNTKKELGVVGPKVLDENLAIQKYTRKPLTFKRYISIKKPFIYFMKKTQKEYLHRSYNYSSNFIFQGMVSGCCFAIKNKIVSAIGGFDENTFLFGEEDIIGIKLMRMGIKAGICIDAEVIHKGSTTIGKKTSPFSDFHRYVSVYYVLVNYVNINMLQRFIIKLINIGGFTIRALFCQNYRKKLLDLVNQYGLITKNYR